MSEKKTVESLWHKWVTCNSLLKWALNIWPSAHKRTSMQKTLTTEQSVSTLNFEERNDTEETKRGMTVKN